MKKVALIIILTVSILLNITLVLSKLIEKEDRQIDYSFSNIKGNPEEQLVEVINEAKSTLKIAIYNLDNEEIAEAILDAKKRGVDVQLITDEDKAANNDTKDILADFTKEDIPMKVNTNNKMHLKLTIADGTTIVTGSFNYTDNSIEENQEVLLAIKSSNLAGEWEEVFTELWESSDYQTWKP